MRRLLWFDAVAGLAVGLALFALAVPLAPLFGYSLPFARGLAAANFGYGCFALGEAVFVGVLAGVEARALARLRAAAPAA